MDTEWVQQNHVKIIMGFEKDGETQTILPTFPSVSSVLFLRRAQFPGILKAKLDDNVHGKVVRHLLLVIRGLQSIATNYGGCLQRCERTCWISWTTAQTVTVKSDLMRQRSKKHFAPFISQKEWRRILVNNWWASRPENGPKIRVHPANWSLHEFLSHLSCWVWRKTPCCSSCLHHCRACPARLQLCHVAGAGRTGPWPGGIFIPFLEVPAVLAAEAQCFSGFDVVTQAARGKHFRLFWLRKKVIKMALLCIKAAPTSGLFPLSPASAEVLQDSQLQDQALRKLLLTILLSNLTSSSLTTPALDYTARTGTIQQWKTCRMKLLERICCSGVQTKPFNSERSAHFTLSPQTTVQ